MVVPNLPPGVAKGAVLCSPAVNADGCEVQLMLALEEQHFGPDFHYRWWVDGHGDSEERQLRMAAGAVVLQTFLAVEVLQPALETQGLQRI